METVVSSQLIDNFSFHIASFWDKKLHKPKYIIRETHEIFSSQNEAVRTAKKMIKERNKNSPVTKRIRTKPPKKEKPQTIKSGNHWIQMNIYE